MDKILQFVKILAFFTENSSSIDEQPGSVNVQGLKLSNLLQRFIELLTFASDCGYTTDQLTVLDEDNQGQSIGSLRERIEDNDPLLSWTINISKQPLVELLSPGENNYCTILFVTKAGFSSFTNCLNSKPFSCSENHSFSQKSLKIFVPGLTVCFGGPNLWIQGLQEHQGTPRHWPFDTSLPTEEDIKKQVHVVPSEKIKIAPSQFLLTWGEISDEAADPFRKIAALMLASCLVKVFYGLDRVVLKGIKHLELPLSIANNDFPDSEALLLLQKTVEWAYAERADTRLSLLEARLTIDLSPEQSLLTGLYNHLENAFQQSQDQYEFVILERKDEYEKERRDLLKDIRVQADLYAIKIRDLLRGLLRDTLAGFIFVGLMGMRVSKNTDGGFPFQSELIFKALSIYFIVSAFLQIYVSIIDIEVSKGELMRWVKQTRNYMKEETIKRQISSTLQARRMSFNWLIFIIGILYCTLAGLSWNLTSML